MITFVALAAWATTPTQAAEIKILVNQGALSGVRDLAAGYEKATGHKVVIDFVGVGEQAEKIKTDAPGDLVVNFMPAFDELVKDGKVIGPVVEFARAGNGVAVKAGAPGRDRYPANQRDPTGCRHNLSRSDTARPYRIRPLRRRATQRFEECGRSA